MNKCAVSSAVAEFVNVRKLMADSFGVASAPALVSAVLSGKMERRGACVNGWQYLIHGVGYTVVTAGGGQVHIDGSDVGDVFTLYDIRSYLDSIGCTVPGLDVIRQECDRLASCQILERVDEIRYSFVGETVLVG